MHLRRLVADQLQPGAETARKRFTSAAGAIHKLDRSGHPLAVQFVEIQHRSAAVRGWAEGQQAVVKLSRIEQDHFLPGEAGLLVADRYDAVIMREALERPLAPARRKAETLRFARRAARRLSAQIDPTLGEGS